MRAQGTAGGLCVQISAALDAQVAQDTDKLSGYVSTGKVPQPYTWLATFATCQLELLCWCGMRALY